MSTCDVFNCLFPLTIVQNAIQLLSRVFCYSWLVAYLGVWIDILFTSLGDDVDRDVLTTFQLKSWNGVQLLLKEECHEDAKQYIICFCRQENEVTRDGKITKKFAYDKKYSVMENKDDRCPHCGDKCYIKYMSLGLENKLRDWFTIKLCVQICLDTV